MRLDVITFIRLMTLSGLLAISVVEALRPGTIGAAVNLGLVVALGGLFLIIKKSPVAQAGRGESSHQDIGDKR